MRHKNLEDQTRSALEQAYNKSDMSIVEVAKEAGVSYEWLIKFTNDAREDYGIRRVQKLYDYLVRKLKLRRIS